ncbi:MAG TPA: beta-propeller fold lactonase family protein [Terriglobales bacterium]|nr:beta-propeller fold lactonase family protein [Terriglobales bacterium]
MKPSKRTSLIFIALGLATLAGCGSASTHTAYVTLPNSNAVAAYRIDNNSAQFTTIVGSPYPAGSSPSSVLVHPSKRFAYVANQSENDISLFTIDSSLGSLKEVLPRTPTGLAPGSLLMDAPGSFLFAVNQVSSSISVYSINSGSGALAPVAGSPFSTFPNPAACAITPSGKFLYVLNPNLASVFAYAITSGVLRPVAGLPVQVGNGPFGITVDPGEKFVYVTNSADNTVSILSINSSTGALTLLGSFATGTQPTSVAVLGQYLYVANLVSSNISVFSVAPTTGVLTQITNSPFSAGGAPLFEVIDPNGKFLYTGSQSANTISVLSIAASTGALTTTSQSALTGVAPSSMSVTK